MQDVKNIQSKRSVIVQDVIAREGYEFCIMDMHTLVGLVPDSNPLLCNLFNVRAQTLGRTYKAYSVLFSACACGFMYGVDSMRFAKSTYDYYSYIGELDYYLGVMNATK